MTVPERLPSDLLAVPSGDPGGRTIVIRPATGWVPLRLRELWEYRELLYFLAWRDIKVRYKQTALGAAWAVLQPLFTMVVFSLFFGRLAQAAVGRRALPALHLLPRWCRGPSSPTRSPQSANSLVDQQPADHQGLFPAAHRAGRGGARRAASTSRIAFVRPARR